MAQAMLKLRCALESRQTAASKYATAAEVRVQMTKPRGTMSSSASLWGLKEKATLEKSSAGVKKELEGHRDSLLSFHLGATECSHRSSLTH